MVAQGKSLIPDRLFGHDLIFAGGEFSSSSCPETSEVRALNLKADYVFDGRPFDRLAGADPGKNCATSTVQGATAAPQLS